MTARPPIQMTTIRVHLRRRKRLGLAELKQYVAGDSPRCGWYLFRISAPAETSRLARLRASAGSFPCILRRIRTRLPTCQSVACGDLLTVEAFTCSLLSTALASKVRRVMRAAVFLATSRVNLTDRGVYR